MYFTTIQADATTSTVTATEALFTPLERAVVEIARGERGRGLRPTSRLGVFAERMLARLTGNRGIRPLADPRLEALRVFVNTLERCGRRGSEQAAATLRTVGFSPLQESWLRASVPACA